MRKGCWSHRDLLRKIGGEIKGAAVEQHAVLRWIVSGGMTIGERTIDRNGIVKKYEAIALDSYPRLIQGFEAIQKETHPTKAAKFSTTCSQTKDSQSNSERVPTSTPL